MKWEYEVELVQEQEDPLSNLNKLGDDGWELVAVVLTELGQPPLPVRKVLAFFFKRPKE